MWPMYTSNSILATGLHTVLRKKKRVLVQTNNLASVMEINCALCKEENEFLSVI